MGVGLEPFDIQRLAQRFVVPVHTQEITILQIVKAHGPVHELTLGNLLSEDQGDILMATIATDHFKQLSHDRLISLEHLHKPSILVDKKPGHSDLQVLPLGLGQQAQQLRLAETDRRGTDLNEMKHGLPHFHFFVIHRHADGYAIGIMGTLRHIPRQP